MPTPLKKQLSALPSYLGGKRRLLAWLGASLEQASPHGYPSTFIDLFMGGGAVSLWAKAQGFEKVIANDISLRSQILAEAFLTNTRIQISRQEALALTQPIPETPGFIEKTYCPHVFSTRHAQALDQGFYWAHQHPNPTKRALLLTLMWHLATDFVAFATSLGNSNRPFAEALETLVSELEDQFPQAKLVGQRDVTPGRDCPCFDVSEWNRTRVQNTPEAIDMAASHRPLVYSVLRQGAKGPLAKTLQAKLNRFSQIDVDGTFGPQIRRAVESFQSHHNLMVDGIVGPKTWTALLRYD